MTWFVLLLPLLIVVFIGVMMLLMPAVIAPTVPLGVSIPRAHVEEPAVEAAVRGYRWGVVGALVASVAAALALAATAPPAAVIIPVLLMLVISTAAYLLARRGIQHAKRAGGWYEDVPVRLTGSISSADSALVRTPIAWYVGALVVLAAAGALGVSVYDGLPDPMPIHWNANGVADGYAAKSAASVFGPLLIGVALVAFLLIIAQLTRHAPMRGDAGESPAVRAEHHAERQRLMQAFLGQITLAMALLFAGMSAVTWLHPEGDVLMPLLSVGFLVVTFALIALLMFRMRRATRAGAASAHGPAEKRQADTPDDDRYWKGGLIYVNRNDPALFVPKRFGIGWTVNAGHPAGMVLVAALILLIVGVAVFVPGGIHPSTSR